MNIVKLLLFAVVAVVAIALLGAGCAYRGYNEAMRLDESVKNQWAQVDAQLQRRYDLIPNLVGSVKGTTQQERDVFLGIAEARKAYFQADTVAEKAQAAGRVEGALARLLLLRETYPALKSSEAFRDLMVALEGTENRLSVERLRYNDAVKQLNTFVRQFPGQLYASLAGVHAAEYFQPDAGARTAPKVDFSKEPQKASG